MNFGKLDRRIAIEQFVLAQSDSGATTKSWQPLTSLWAAIKWRSGGEMMEGKQEQGFNTVEFTVRYCKSLSGVNAQANELMRIKYNDEYFDILYVNEIDRGKYHQIIAKRKTVYQEQ